MAAVLEVDRDEAKELLVALGLKTAKKYTDAKLLGMLTKLDATDDTADPGSYSKLYKKIVKANQDEKDIVLASDDDAEEEEEEEEEKPKKGRGRKAKESAEDDEPAPKGKKGKAAKSDDEEKPKRKTIGGNVRQTDSEGRTAKDRVYLEWIELGGKKLDAEDTDYGAIAKAAKAEDKAPGTIRGWISAWRSDKGLPRISKNMPEPAPAKKGKKGKKSKSDDE